LQAERAAGRDGVVMPLVLHVIVPIVTPDGVPT
jgi:hypothetical protein